MRDLVEGVLEDGGSKEVYRRPPKRVFQARAGRRSTTNCGAGVATRWDTAKLYLLELDRTVILSDAVFIRRQKQSEERTAHLAVGCNTL